MRKFLSPSMCVSLAALVISLGGVGYSATGGAFILGQSNSATNRTILTSNLNDRAMQLNNAHAGGAATGLSISVAPTRPPLSVNSSVRVANLNADLLDGIDATGFVQGTADGQAIALAPSTTVFVGPAAGGFMRLRYACPFGLGGNGALRIINNSTSLANVFVDSGGANPDYIQLGAGGFIEYPAAAGGESFWIQAQNDVAVETIAVGTVHRASSNDCHAQALMMVSG